MMFISNTFVIKFDIPCSFLFLETLYWTPYSIVYSITFAFMILSTSLNT